MMEVDAVAAQSKGPAHRLDVRLGLIALWWLTGERPSALGPPSIFDDEGEVPGGYSGSTNMRAMADAHAYAYHAKFFGVERYRDRLLDHLHAQVRPGTSKWSGLMGDEQASPGIHGSYHTNSVAIVHLVASLAGDTEVLQAAEAWFANYHALAERCHTTTGEVVLPGLNWRRRPSTQPLWSAIYRSRHGLGYLDRGMVRLAHAESTPELLQYIRRDTSSLALFIGLIQRRRKKPSMLDIPAATGPVALHWPMEVIGEPGHYTARLIRDDNFERLWAKGMWRKWVCREVVVKGDKWKATIADETVDGPPVRKPQRRKGKEVERGE